MPRGLATMSKPNLIAKLGECTDKEVGAALTAAVSDLFSLDRYLFELGVHERTVVAALAFHMRGRFGSHDVDAEYNKLGDDPKRVVDIGKVREVVPDLIVHKRGYATVNNLLVMEVKHGSRGKSADDIHKLTLMQRDLEYRHAVFIRFGVKGDAGKITELEWVKA